MAAELIARARTGDEEAFRELVEPHRRELQLHCYRLLGSTQDAEDGLQETLLAAWQGMKKFEGRSTIRTWLYRIATNRCLNMLRADSRRPKVEEQMGDVQLPEPTGRGEVSWIEPYPDTLLEGLADGAPGPEARYESREAISLAFITALQLLPPRQRAVLILRDVLGYHASEVAQMLDSSEESVTSAHKRARATLESRTTSAHPLPPPPARSAAEQELVERFTRAFESSDAQSLVGLLTHDVLFTMPPLPFEWQGSDQAMQFLRAMWNGHPGRRLVVTRANNQPAFGLYIPDPHTGVLHAMGLMVLTLAGHGISAITRFENTVLTSFGLPRTLAAELDPTGKSSI